MPDWKQIVQQHFPNAQDGVELTNEIIQKLESQLSLSPDQVLLSTSICPDELNVLSTKFADSFIGPFFLGGLAGFPFGGLTAMTAYSHHVPDEGAAFILYGPHIGISEAGDTGVTGRPGKANHGASCGALMLALSRLQEAGARGETYHRPAEEPDYQQAALENMLAQHQARILTSDDPKREISLVAYELIHKRIQETVEAVKSEFHGKHIVLLGGILINVDPAHQDYFETRHYEVIHL